MWLWILIIAISVIVDQITKQVAARLLADVGSVEVIPEILRFTYVENEGAAFGMLSDHRWVFMVISTVAIVGILIYLWKCPPESKFACIGMSLIIGGGVGNMIDRIYLDYVIDFIDFCAFPDLWVWVFNVADSCVCVGAGMLIVWCIVSLIKESKEARIKKEAPASVTEEKASEVDADIRK